MVMVEGTTRYMETYHLSGQRLDSLVGKIGYGPELERKSGPNANPSQEMLRIPR